MKRLLVLVCLLSMVAQAQVLGTYQADPGPYTEGRRLALTIEAPPVTAARYSVVCQVKGSARGHLELLNHFGPQGTFFTRLPLKKGVVQLPFNATTPDGKVLTPKKLELFVVVEQGEVELETEVKLLQGDAAVESGWWSPRQAGMVGAIGGVTLGLMGALVGLLASTRPRLVLTLCKGLSALGLALLAVGGVAWLSAQPYHVYYPLLLCGMISAAVFFSSARQMEARVRDQELRSMAAQDA